MLKLRNTRNTRKRLVHEPFVLDLWLVPEVHRQARLLAGRHFRAFRVFRSSSPTSRSLTRLVRVEYRALLEICFIGIGFDFDSDPDFDLDLFNVRHQRREARGSVWMPLFASRYFLHHEGPEEHEVPRNETLDAILQLRDVEIGRQTGFDSVRFQPTRRALPMGRFQQPGPSSR